MKIKLSIILSLMSFTLIASAQDNSTANKSSKMESNVIVNGMPYSQYKAQLQAKQMQDAKTAPTNSSPMKAPVLPQGNAQANTNPFNKVSDDGVAKPDAKPVDGKGTSLEVKPVSENTKPSVENKTAPSSVTPKAPVSKQGAN